MEQTGLKMQIPVINRDASHIHIIHNNWFFSLQQKKRDHHSLTKQEIKLMLQNHPKDDVFAVTSYEPPHSLKVEWLGLMIMRQLGHFGKG